MTAHTSSASDDDSLSALIDSTLPCDRAADALSGRLETIMSRLARIRAELAELRARERASGGGRHD
jgi:hypothetical protein